MGQLDLTKPLPTDVQEKKSFAELVRSKVSTVLVGKKADDFVASLVSLMNQDPALKNCDQISLVGTALQAQSLGLSLHKAMGHAWIVPFRDNRHGRIMATFQMGYKGYVQLAIRSGYYKKLNVLPIKEGELKAFDPLNEEIDVELIQDEDEREKAPTIGYYAMFEYLNGFRKAMYWTKPRMEAHAKRYSKAYSAKNSSSFWLKDFDAMACKTMLRQILSKWGIMSVEMQQAMQNDMRVADETGEVGDIVDTDYDVIPDTPTADRPERDEEQSASPTIDCPDKGKTVTEHDCSACSMRQGCPAWE